MSMINTIELSIASGHVSPKFDLMFEKSTDSVTDEDTTFASCCVNVKGSLWALMSNGVAVKFNNKGRLTGNSKSKFTEDLASSTKLLTTLDCSIATRSKQGGVAIYNNDMSALKEYIPPARYACTLFTISPDGCNTVTSYRNVMSIYNKGDCVLEIEMDDVISDIHIDPDNILWMLIGNSILNFNLHGICIREVKIPIDINARKLKFDWNYGMYIVGAKSTFYCQKNSNNSSIREVCLPNNSDISFAYNTISTVTPDRKTIQMFQYSV